MTPIYTPPKQDESKERALTDAIKRRDEDMANLDPFITNLYPKKIEIEKEKG